MFKRIICRATFGERKSELAITVNQLMKELKTMHKIKVKKVQCKNSGEKMASEALCKQEGYGVTFEYIAPGTLHQSSKVD